MVNRRGPSLPCRSLNPLTGIREVPVVNCSNRDFFSASHVRIAFFENCQLISFARRRGEGLYLPKPLYDIVAFSVSSIIGMLFPIVYIHLCDSADEKFQFTFVKYIDQILGDELIESLRKVLKLFFNPFLDPPIRDKTVPSMQNSE